MKKVIWVVFALLLHSAAGAQGFSLADEARRERERREGMETDRQRLLKEVLKHTNAAEALAQLSKGFSDSADKMFGQFPHEARDPLKKATLEALSSSRLLPVYERSFSTGIDIMTLTAVSDWSKTAIGAKIFRVETVENGRPDENFLKRPVSRNRSMLIEELERETKETERAVAAVTSLSHAMLGGMLEFLHTPADEGRFIVRFRTGVRGGRHTLDGRFNPQLESLRLSKSFRRGTGRVHRVYYNACRP